MLNPTTRPLPVFREEAMTQHQLNSRQLANTIIRLITHICEHKQIMEDVQ
jgi:hypothetical protein